jgi:ergothioneine biosynthesis protein EgtB
MTSIRVSDRPTAAAPPSAPATTSLAQHYASVRSASVALCEPLAPEDYVVQSMPDASPAKWHLAHTSWFFEEFVLQTAPGACGFHDERYRYLFNSYYETVGPRHARPQRGLLSRPTVDEVLAYRASVDERMAELLHRGVAAELEQIITLGLHHEQQHQELILTDVKHLFSCNPLLPAYRPRSSAPAAAGAASRGSAQFIGFEGGLHDIGATGAAFCFDNELPRHRVWLEPFELANRPVSNSEYLEFVRDGGYRKPQCWLSDGWASVQREGWTHPIYWSESLDSEFTLSGLRELDPDAPVCHVSFYEADAFARWAGARLPTEFEWEIAAAKAPREGNFVESGKLHPVPASRHSPTPAQMLGDVWEWTQSSYAPYPGFAPLSGSLGEYNGKFMVNQLVLRGGSCATPASHIRASYRNFFYPTARWQFSGLRLAKSRAASQGYP